MESAVAKSTVKYVLFSLLFFYIASTLFADTHYILGAFIGLVGFALSSMAWNGFSFRIQKRKAFLRSLLDEQPSRLLPGERQLLEELAQEKDL